MRMFFAILVLLASLMTFGTVVYDVVERLHRQECVGCPDPIGCLMGMQTTHRGP